MTQKITDDYNDKEVKSSFIRFRLSDEDGDYIDVGFNKYDSTLTLRSGWKGALSISPEASNVISVKIEER